MTYIAFIRFKSGGDKAGRGVKSNHNPGRNSKIVAPGFGKATIYDFECRSWLPPAGIQPAGERKATITPAGTPK